MSNIQFGKVSTSEDVNEIGKKRSVCKTAEQIYHTVR